MEFEIPKEFIQPYVDNCKKLIFEQSKKGISEDEILKKILIYFKENELEEIIDKKDSSSCCYEFALNTLNIYYPYSATSDEFKFAEFINSNKTFEEIKSKDEIRVNQMVVYYSNPREYLHAGIIESTQNKKIKVISQWGDEIKLIHPIERINHVYGNKYKIFKINKLENEIYESEENLQFNHMNKIFNEMKSMEDAIFRKT